MVGLRGADRDEGVYRLGQRVGHEELALSGLCAGMSVASSETGEAWQARPGDFADQRPERLSPWLHQTGR